MSYSHYLKDEFFELIKKDSTLFDFVQMLAPDGLWYWDLEHPEHKWVNAKFWQTLGYDPAEMSHRAEAWQDIVNPDDLQVVLTNVHKHIADPNHPYDQILRYHHKDGSTVWVRCRGMAIRDDKGEAVRMLGAHTDITKDKEDEERQQEVTSYQTLLGNQKAYVIKTDAEGNYTYVNDLYLSSFYLERDTIMGTSSLDSIHVEDHPKTIEVASACLACPHTPFNVTLRKPLPDGSLRTTDWEFIGLTDEAGNVNELMCIGIDVTDKLAAEADLERTITLLEDAGRIANIGGWELDVATGKVTLTKQVYAIHELPSDAPIDVAIGVSFYHPDDQPIIANALEQAIEQQQPYDLQCRFVTAKGNHRWVRASGYPVVENGEVIRLFGLFQDITEQKEAELALQRTKTLLEDAGRIAKMGAWEFDTATDIGTFTDQVYAIHELPISPSIDGKEAYMFYHPDDQPIITAAVDRAIEQQEPYDVQCRFITAKGNHRWVRTSGQPVIENGKVTRLIGLFQDITEQKEAELALQESEHRYRLLAENSQDLICLNKLDGTFIYASPAYERLLGYSQAELFALPPQALIHPDDASRGYTAHQGVLAGHLAQVEYRLKKKDGSYLWVESNASLVNDQISGEQRLLAISRDISNRKQAEQALAASEATFRSFIENASDAIFTLSPQGTLLYISPQWETVKGFSSEGLVGTSFVPLIHPDDVPAALEAVTTVVTNKKPYHGFVYRSKHGDGTWHWFSANGAPIFDDTGNVTAILTTSRDITHDKHAEQAMQATLEQLEQTHNQNIMLMKEIHHRVKNNLAVISALLALRAQGLKDVSAKAALQESRQRIKVMAEIHELMYNHDSTGTIAFDVYLTALVNRMQRSFACGEQPIHFVLQISNVELSLDQAIPLGLIINELLTNATKHAFSEDHPEPRVAIIVTAADEVIIEVVDNGGGVADEGVLEATDSLGMTVIQSLTDQLAGHITFSNRPSSEAGLHVTLYIPLISAHAQPTISASAVSSGASAKNTAPNDTIPNSIIPDEASSNNANEKSTH